MAIVPVHKRITETVLQECGFSPGAIEIAAQANALVDEKQGNQAAETNLHAMRGFVDGVMQSEGETRREVARLLEDARRDILEAITAKNKDYTAALRRLGEALHTVQDAAIHHFEPWPYTGIGNAIRTDPAYMLMHGARDLCLTRYLVAGSASLDHGGWGMAAEVGFATYFSTRWFPDSVGLRGDYISGGSRPPQVAGLLTLCWGACPGTGASPASRSAQPVPLGTSNRSAVFQPNWSYELKIRPEVLQDAEDKSREFVNSIKNAAGPAWIDFTKS
jgi:hypothetical protein